ncbi:MAG: hypothetical protein IJS09_08405 [Treponema sp.]|nr:hypothetical protein [Treponema sp.]
MKKLISFAFAALLAVGAFAQTVAVLGFESDNFCIEERTGTMSDLLTDELVGLPHITVVERKHIDKVTGEMKFQAKPYTDPATAKSLGKMVGADCVIVGSADVFAGTLTVTARTIEVETAKILYSTKMTCDTWSEFNRKLPDFARNLVSVIPVPERFTGTWTGTVQTDSYTDEYEITFEKKGKCTVRVTPDGNFGSPLTAKGTWSDSDDILHINARFKTDIARLKTMNWAAVYALGDDGESFSMNIRGEGDKLVRVVFAKTE